MKMRRTITLRSGVALLLFIVSVTCQSDIHYRLQKHIFPTIYDIHITVDLDILKFSGSETIYVNANQPTSAIELHALDLSIDDVQVIEGENAISISSTEYANETQIFKIILEHNLAAGRNYHITLNFEGAIRDDMKGLYRSSYYENSVVK